MTGAGDREPSGLYARLGELVAALALWNDRDDSRPQPEVRQAANDAMDAIDAILRELGATRARLAGEIRESGDAAMERSRALLERIREEAGGD